MRELLVLGERLGLLPGPAMTFGGQLHAGGSVADQSQQLEPGAVTGRERRMTAAGQGLQDLEFVWRHAHGFSGHEGTNAARATKLPKERQSSGRVAACN